MSIPNKNASLIAGTTSKATPNTNEHTQELRQNQYSGNASNKPDWLSIVVSMAIEKGHRVIPIIGEKPAPYGNGERYPLADKIWKNSKLNRERLAVALDDFILTDYDGNKPEGAIPLEQLLCDPRRRTERSAD